MTRRDRNNLRRFMARHGTRGRRGSRRVPIEEVQRQARKLDNLERDVLRLVMGRT